ncbi:D-amino-acid transaminase [Pseudogracilibacillus auburnensis]|uniref:D-alanine aminotransferase n=1 Tax=Pseudogracilibacillus auburnensis TaxID=1494959 RepID=A0A2V3W1B6_9BACI|nr:D-amino-acid transaminase [Pseudogracilibacillus auburnensis]MBO1005351.1 D-amino-acid transaminase [Pseudogracilibacillus auburnensis]PXW86974.1 D-alanine transaminase [Pseudogracilibacillus auburnensis]
MSMYPIIMSQGKFTHKDSLTFPYEERGLQFGDGVYEVIRIYEGRLYLFNEHIDRLFRSLDAIQIKIQQSKEEIKSLLTELVARNNMEQDGLVYLQVSRGSATRIHTFPEDTVPNMYAYLENAARNLNGIENGVKTITLRDERWQNCYIKSLNLLPNVLAKQTAAGQGCYEAILHEDGLVTECGSSNVFLVKEGKVYTHPATNRILKGCVRMAVERFCNELDIPFIEEAFTVNDIHEADEMFLTSSMSEVLPIIQVDGKLIKDGKPGVISGKLQEAYEKDAQLKLETIK